MPVSEGTKSLKAVVGEYDFDVDGGAVSTITLRGSGPNGNQIPNGSVLVSGYIEVDTALTGATATVSVNSEAAGDLQAAAAISGAPWSTTGRKDIVPDGTGSTAVKTTASRSLAVTVGTAALTAGKFRVVVFYI